MSDERIKLNLDVFSDLTIDEGEFVEDMIGGPMSELGQKDGPSMYKVARAIAMVLIKRENPSMDDKEAYRLAGKRKLDINTKEIQQAIKAAGGGSSVPNGSGNSSD